MDSACQPQHDLHQTLKRLYGYQTFRPHQEAIITALLAGQDAFVVMPTGGGKSLCFQLPAHLLPGTCIVVSPLISLMKDQVDAARGTGLRAAYLNSSQTPSEQRAVAADLARGTLDLLYVAPERFAVPGFRDALCQAHVNLFAIDEAHCISEWGHDFRPDYLALAALVKDFPAVPLAAFTATATRPVQADIVQRLGLRNPLHVRASFDRPNLFYAVSPKTNIESQILAYVSQHDGEPGIVYRATRKAVEATCAHLVAQGVAALPYHAGMEDADRHRNQEAFRRDEVQTMVATIAFGMGIDKPNVRWIVHGDLPKNLESYYQETGRAGRDGDPAHCQLFFSAGDAARIQHFIRENPHEDERSRLQALLAAMLRFASSNLCRRRQILAYFDEDYGQDTCPACDVCRGEVQTVDASIDAQKAMSAVLRAGQRYGIRHTVDILVGADTANIRAANHHQLKTYGVGTDRPRQHWQRVIDDLLAQGCLARSSDRFPTLSVTPKGRIVLVGQRPFRMLEAITPATRKARDAGDEYDPLLLADLRDWRKATATRLGLPSYVVFSDQTLRRISAAKPASRDALRAVHGVGDHKLTQYGDELLARVASFVHLHPDSPAVAASPITPSASPPPPTCQLTCALFDRGLDPEAIATHRGLSLGTILGHLEEALAAGHPVDIGRLSPPRQMERIQALMEELGDERLGPIVERGGGAFDYNAARLARLLRRPKRELVG